MDRVTIDQAREQLEELLRKALDGEEVVIAVDADDEVELVARRPHGRSLAYGSYRGKMTMSADFDEPLEDFKEHTEWGV